MPNYFHDLMHCSQKECKAKDKCYRYWLGEHLKYSGFRYASFYYPEKPVTEKCEHFINLKDYE